jgi:TM2 domain-containing membrane protein YozV
MSTMNASPYADPQILFQQQYESVRRDEVVGVLLAFFLGCFGIHHFYLNRVGLGILYCCFCWTGIPAIIGVVECFFMPGRVRMYNAMQAAAIAAALGIVIPGYAGYPAWSGSGWSGSGFAPGYAATAPYASSPAGVQSQLTACAQCGQTNAAGSRFCSACGSAMV